MKMTATSLVRPQLLSRSGLTTRAPDYFALMKPRVMLLAVFTAFVGMTLAPVSRDPLLGLLAMFAIAVGAGGAGVLNMWYDADIDAAMARTARRPIPRGSISPREALAFGLVLSFAAVIVLGIASNAVAAGLLAFTIFFYAVVYTVWLKRHTPQNIVIGGVAGALPPVVGWTTATGDIGLEPVILFLIIFLWTPPHFWALSLNRAAEYERAGVPMLPVVAGRAATTQQNSALHHCLGPGLHAAMGFRVCRADIWCDRTRPRSDLCCACVATAPEPGDRPASAASPVPVLHLLPVPVVCRFADRRQR